MTDQTSSSSRGGQTARDNRTDEGTRGPVPPTPTPPTRRRGWALGMAAVVIIALFVLGTTRFLGGEETPGPAAPTEPTVTDAQIAAAIEAAEAYLRPSAPGYVETVRSLVAEGFRPDGLPNVCSDPANLEWCLRMRAGYEFEHRDLECALVTASPRLTVRCEGNFTYGVDRRTPTNPPTPAASLVVFDDAGLIQSERWTAPTREEPEITDQDVLDWQNEFDSFGEWTAFIERVDPDFAALNERALNQELGPEEAAEFFEKLAQYLDRYEDYANEAYEAWLRSREEG